MNELEAVSSLGEKIGYTLAALVVVGLVVWRTLVTLAKAIGAWIGPKVDALIEQHLGLVGDLRETTRELEVSQRKQAQAMEQIAEDVASMRRESNDNTHRVVASLERLTGRGAT